MLIPAARPCIQVTRAADATFRFVAETLCAEAGWYDDTNSIKVYLGSHQPSRLRTNTAGWLLISPLPAALAQLARQESTSAAVLS